MMTQPTKFDQSQLVVLAMYPKGHYRRSVNPNWHVYGDLAFANDEDGTENATKLVSLLKLKGVKAKVEYRGVIKSREDEIDFTPPKACLKVASGDMADHVHKQDPVDAALVDLYNRLSEDDIRGLGEGSMGYYPTLSVRELIADDITVHRARYTNPSMDFVYDGMHTTVDMVGGTVYNVSCKKYGTPTLITIKARVETEGRLVFGKYVDSANRWPIAYWVPGNKHELAIKKTPWGPAGYSYRATAKESINQCQMFLFRYVMLELIKIRDAT